MKFERVQFLRKEAIGKLKSDANGPATESIDLNEALHFDALSLAYLGDGAYSMYVRNRIIRQGLGKVQIAHFIVSKVISAKGQAKSYSVIEDKFTEEERMVAKRGRNANVSVPKSASVREYRLSTAFEAVLGYLYMTDQRERLREICCLAFEVVLDEL